MDTDTTGNTWSLRVFILALFVHILFIGIVSSYYIFDKTNWSQMDQTMAVAMKLFYIYMPLSSLCLFMALVWLVMDERKIRKLSQQLKKEKNKMIEG